MVSHAVLTHDLVDTALLHSERAQQVAHIFGIDARNTTRRLLDRVRVPTAGITYITGHSGSGKSTLLARVAALRPEVRTLEAALPDDRAVIDLFPGALADAIHWLGKFGLGEARLLLARPAQLSEGQQHRLRLARLLLARPPVLLVDEFLSMLDRVTARAIAHNFQKVCREAGVTAYLATAHDDLIDALQPDAVIRLDLDGSSTTDDRAGAGATPFEATALGSELVAGAGTLDDYRALAVFHYREEADPASAWGALLREVRTVRFGGRPVAVKLFTRPFARGLEAVPLFRALNEQVVVQERTIVHPVFRGLALNRLMTPTFDPAAKIVFAQSALGQFFPYNLKAGFVRVAHPAEHPAPAQLALQAHVRALAGPALNLQSSAQLAALFAGLSAPARAAVQDRARAAFVDVNTRFVELLAAQIGRSPSAAEHAQLVRLFERLFDRGAATELAHLVETAMPFPMAAFVRSLP